MEEAAGILKGIKEYLGFLIENGVLEMSVSAEGASKWGEGARVPGPDTGVDRGGPQLGDICGELVGCVKCPLGRSRKNLVFGEGNPRPEIVFVGEGPGEEEDRTGRPFVGPSGHLLTRMIEKAMGIPRQQVYICNIVKCRPPGNRTPREEEIRACLPFLERQIEALGPKVIITLGQPASCALLGIRKPIHLLRGKWQSYRGTPLMPTFHPAYVLREYTVPIRRLVFEDLQEVMKVLGMSGDPPR